MSRTANDTPKTIRLKILGSLEIEREDGCFPPPKTAAAHYVLALFAVKDRYEDQELVHYLWPGSSLTDERLGVPASVRANLSRALSDARAALGVTASSGVLKREMRTIRRTATDSLITITSDLEAFDELAASPEPEDCRAALALVRGPVAEYVPTKDTTPAWIKDRRKRQKETIEELLSKTEPDLPKESLPNRTQEILEGRAAAIPPPAHPDEVTGGPADQPRQEASNNRRVSKRRWTTRRRIVAAVLVVAAAAATIALTFSGGGQSIPPEGSVINAETGSIVRHPRVVASKLPAQIEGGAYFRACALAELSSCAGGHSGPTPLKVKVGDVVTFRVSLNNGSADAVHSLKLEAYAQARVLDEAEHPHSSQTELEISMSVKWPEGAGVNETVDEPDRIDDHPDETWQIDKKIYLRLPRPGRYRLVYIPGSTTLVNRQAHFFHYLPNGIMNYGIELENVGPPPSCFWCAYQYVRWVYFKARVATDTSE